VGAQTKQALGQAGEDLAAQVLADNGAEIIARNWRGRQGELDIIAFDKGALIAVEVKTRSGTAFGTPAAAISEAKIKRMRKVFGQWMSEHKTELRSSREIRLDAISILLKPNSSPIIEHIRGIS
jgi:putative endonuclease